MNLLRLAAFVLFLFATLAAFGWLIHLTLGHTVGLVAAGLLCYVLSTVPMPPSSPLR